MPSGYFDGAPPESIGSGGWVFVARFTPKLFFDLRPLFCADPGAGVDGISFQSSPSESEDCDSEAGGSAEFLDVRRDAGVRNKLAAFDRRRGAGLEASLGSRKVMRMFVCGRMPPAAPGFTERSDETAGRFSSGVGSRDGITMLSSLSRIATMRVW